jgi:predicted Zn-dependent protease
MKARFRFASKFSLLLMLIVAIAPLTACSTNQATGRSQLNVLSEEQEISIGEKAEPQFLEEGGGPIPDPAIQQYVSDLGHRLAALSERPDLPWEFHTLNSDMINAFALPGGKVFISRGLMAKMTNEAQLVGVLGHEVGHVTAKHINDRMARQMIVAAIVAGAGVAAQTSDDEYIRILGGTAAGAGGTLYLLSFSRGQEHESDELGIRYMVKAGYDPRGQVQVMEILNEASGGGGVEWLQTHPLPESRIDELRDLINDQYAYTRDNPNFKLGQASFKRNVLDRLAKLPEPKDAAKSDDK